MIYKTKSEIYIDRNAKLELIHHQEIIRKLKEEKQKEVQKKNGRNNN